MVWAYKKRQIFELLIAEWKGAISTYLNMMPMFTRSLQILSLSFPKVHSGCHHGATAFWRIILTEFFIETWKIDEKNWLEQKISIDVSQMTKNIFFKFPTRST